MPLSVARHLMPVIRRSLQAVPAGETPAPFSRDGEKRQAQARVIEHRHRHVELAVETVVERERDRRLPKAVPSRHFILRRNRGGVQKRHNKQTKREQRDPA